MDAPLSVLLVTHFFAPSPSAGANRATAFARHLRARGHDVTVLTSAAFGALPEDAAVGNVRTWDLQLLPASLPWRSDATAGPSVAASPSAVHPLSRVLVPDAHLLAWTPFALARAARLARAKHFDCVFTTSPPESVHLVGAVLHRRRIPWVADLRDGWAFEPWIKQELWPTRAQHRLNEWLERHVLGTADGLTAISPTVVDYLRKELDLSAELLPNGWEPGSEPDTALDGFPELDPSRVSAIYTGEIAGARRDAAPLIHALATLAHEDPATAIHLEILFAGSFTEEERELMRTDCSPARIVNVGRLGRERVRALQRAADAAIDLTPRAGRQATSSKLYEYIGAGLPILALAPLDGAAAGIVAAANGIVVDTHDGPRIKAALRALAGGEIRAPGEDIRRTYAWPTLTERLEDVLRATVSRKTRPVNGTNGADRWPCGR